MNLDDLLVSYNIVNTRQSLPKLPSFELIPINTEFINESNSSEHTSSEPSSAIEYVPLQQISKPKPKPKQNRVSYSDRNKWVADLTAAYRKAGITNDNALKMLIAQDALESAWGHSAQGKFNFGNLTTGAKWKGNYVIGNDKNAKGQAIKQKFRSYDSIDEYAADKIQFLKRLYDFDENDDINKFTAKLTGSNKGKRKYAENTSYTNLLTKVFNSFKKGGIIKAQIGTIIPDNTRIVKPIIQEKIQKTYPIQQQSYFVQDNRSDQKRQEDYNNAQVVYNQYMQDKRTEKGLRNLNGFLTFTDYVTMGLGAGSLSKKPVPTKHTGIFHPSLINTKNWTLNSPDWNNPNRFKVGIPGIMGFN